MAALQQKNTRNYIFQIQANSTQFLSISTFDYRTGEYVPDIYEDDVDSKIFMESEDLPDDFKKNAKAVIIILNEYNFRNNALDIALPRSKIMNDLKKNNIPFRVLPNSNFLITCALIATEVFVNEGEKVIIVLVSAKTLHVWGIERFVNGYKIITKKQIECEENYDPTEVRQKIMEGCVDPKNIIVTFDDETPETFELLDAVDEKILKSDEIIVTGEFIAFYYEEASMMIAKNIIENQNEDNKYYVIPQAYETFVVSHKLKITNADEGVLSITPEDTLPISKTCVSARTFFHLHWLYLQPNNHQFERVCAGNHDLDYRLCHKVEMKLSVDINNRHEFSVTPLFSTQVEQFPSKLNADKDLKFPVIGFFDNSSIICVKNNGKYSFLNEWTGVFGKDLFLSFKEEKPVLCPSIFPCFVETPKNVVFDLVKIMSMHPEAIEIDSNWGFKITKDSKHPVLLEFDSFNGTRRVSSPAFLMALFLKEHIEAIKTETGEKTQGFTFCIFACDFSKETMKRVELQLEEACKLLKLSCNFIMYPKIDIP